VAIHRDPVSARSVVTPQNDRFFPAAPDQRDSLALAENRAFHDDVVAGLTSSPRKLPCKYFYDQTGAQLFQKICQLPEYYITRTEIGILRVDGADIAAVLGADIELIGLGTGAGTKTRILLQELQDPRVYVPIDISKEQLAKSSARMR
jgi:L-histidine N-alpha-methyltransferase